MKLLFDQNLSRRLVGRLRDFYPDSTHVTTKGLDTATDREIWDYARNHDYTIVSKDSDFRQLVFLYGAPPKVIWLRLGNVSTAVVAGTIIDSSEVIESFHSAEEEALLVLPALPPT